MLQFLIVRMQGEKGNGASQPFRFDFAFLFLKFP